MISSVRSATKCNINRCVNYTFIWLYSTTNHIFVYVCVYVCVERTIITGLYVSEPKSPPPRNPTQSLVTHSSRPCLIANPKLSVDYMYLHL